MDDVGLVETILDLTGLSFGNSLGNIGGNGACLGAGHKSAGAEDFTETADETHHVGRCDSNVEIHKAFALDPCDKILSTDYFCAGGYCCVCVCTLSENGDSDGTAGSVGKDDCAADLLVSVTGVNAQTDVNFNSLVKFSGCALNGKLKCLGRLIESGLVDELGAFIIFLSVFHVNFSSQSCG